MSRLCISKNHKYPYIKFNWFMGIQHSSLGFNKELTARVCGFEVKEFNDKYPEYAIQYDEDEHGDALIKVRIPANGDTVIGGYITTIKDDATKSENYTTYATETLSGYDCDNLDTIFTARVYGNAFSIWRTDDGRLYIHKLKYVYRSADITRRISRPWRASTNSSDVSWLIHDRNWMAAYEENTKQSRQQEVNTMENVRIFNAHVVMSNFAGHKSLYNPLGKRSLTISMPMKDVDPNTSLGKVIGKVGKVRTIGDDTYMYVTIKINESAPTKIIVDCEKRIAHLGPDDIIERGDMIDEWIRDGKHINMVCKPCVYTAPKDGGTGIVLYLKAIRFERPSNNWFDDKDTWEQGELPFDYEERERQAQEIANQITGVKKVMPKNFDKVVVSGPATIAWINGKKVMVKKSEGDTYDYEKAMLALQVKALFGDNEAAFHRWCRTNLKSICKAVKKDAKLSAEKAERKSKKTAPAPKAKNKVGEQNSYNRWTKEELDFLLANYKTMTNKELGEHLGRSYASVQTQLNRLKLTRG